MAAAVLGAVMLAAIGLQAHAAPSCGVHGRAEGGKCVCAAGWSGSACETPAH